MEAEDPLAQLADIHLPDAVPFWPPAPGWWILAILILAVLCWLGYMQYKRWQQSQRLGQALATLALAYKRYKSASQAASNKHQAGLDFLYDINSLLKRVALVHFPKAEVASLTGQDWLNFLDQHGATTSFTNGEGQVLSDGEYRKEFTADPTALYHLVRAWVQFQYRLAESTKPKKAAAQTEVTA